MTSVTNIGFNKTTDQATTINGKPTTNIGFQCGDGTVHNWMNTSCASELPEKVDGGYYIYTKDQYAHFNALYVTNSYGTQRHPNCQ